MDSYPQKILSALLSLVHGARYCALLAIFSFVALPLPAGAAEKAFTLGNAKVTLEEVTSEVGVFRTSLRYNRISNVWNFEVNLTNLSTRTISGPIVLSIESFGGTSGPVAPDGTDDTGKTFFDLSAALPKGQLTSGERSLNRTLSFGYTPGAVPIMSNRVFALPPQGGPAVALVRSLNEVGQPLPGVLVEETGPLGTRTNQTESIFGTATVGQGAGPHTWKFSRPGYLAAWRQLTLSTGALAVLPDPRLVRQSATAFTITPIGGIQVSNPDGSVRLSFAAGTVSQQTTVTLTSLGGQTLPGYLPLGWSPLQAFRVDLSSPPTTPVPTTLSLWGPLGAAEPAALARWNEVALRWETISIVPGNGTATVTSTIPGTGSYALAVADTGAGAPPAAVIGPLLPGTLTLPGPSSLSAGGVVTPSVSTASRMPEEVTGTFTVFFTNRLGPLPSGAIFQCDLTESYSLVGGGQRHTPAYENFIVAYQRPGDSSANTLQAMFPLRPLLLFGSEELDLATVKVDVLSPQAFAGTVFTPAGGFLANGAVQVLGGEGDVSGTQAAQLRVLDPALFGDFNTNGVNVLGAFELTVAGVAPGRELHLQMPSVTPTNNLVLARVLYDQGLYGLLPVERLRSDPAGRLLSAEPQSGEKLPGLAGAGQYLVLQLNAPQGLVSGTARNSAGVPAGGLPVQISGEPWLAFSAANGAFQLLAPTGSVQVAVTDLASGDRGTVSVTVSNLQTATTVDLATVSELPRVSSITPANGAIGVSRVTPVVITFSKPVNPGTLIGSGLQLLDPNGLAVLGSLSLNLRNTAATLLPNNPLDPGTLYTVNIASNVTDFAGTPLQGTGRTTFQTAAAVARADAANLTIFQPGATNLSINGIDVRSMLPGFDLVPDKANLVVAYGGPGTAEGQTAVILVNETSGETATVLSKTDGSFAGFISAAEEDFISAVFVNANGSRNTVPAGSQHFDDGSVGLYHGGGIVATQGESGPMQVIVEPGSVLSRTRLSLTPVPASNLVALVEGQQPVGGKLLGGFRYEESGNALSVAADVTFSVNVADLGLSPTLDPTNGTYALVIPRKYNDVVVYEIIDTMVFEPTGPGRGRLVTHSPPFPGLLAQKLAAMQKAAQLIDRLGQVNISSTDPLKVGVAIGAGVVALDRPFTQGGKVAGIVRSAPVDANGNLTAPAQPLSGALVVLDRVLAERPPSFFEPGEMVATSDANGSYAMILRPSEQGVGQEARASHPRFPFQTARAPISLDPGNTSVARSDLLFAEAVDTSSPGQVSAPPVISISYSPPLPPASSNPADSAAVTVTVTGVLPISDTRLEVIAVRGPDGETLQTTVVPPPVAGPATGSAGRQVTTFKVGCPVTAQVRLRVTSVSGNLSSQTETFIPFGLSAVTPPTLPHTGPHVALVWPPDHSKDIPSLSPVLLRFSEPLLPADLQPDHWNLWLGFDNQHNVRLVQPSSDRKELTIFYSGDPNGDVQLTVLPALHDQDNNPFDQNPASTNSAQNHQFSCTFTQAGQRRATLDNSQRGAGIVVQGRFAYALDNQGETGRLISYDLNDPAKPTIAATRSLDGRPATLTLIPSYPLPHYVVDNQGIVQAQGCEPEANLLAVFFGGVNELKQLLILPANGTFSPLVPRPAAAVLTEDPAAQVVKAKWDPPFIGYLQFAQANSISLLNLPAFYLGATLRETNPDALAKLPRDGDPGLDQNGDGDYCANGDRAPLPLRDPLKPFGFSFSFAPSNPKEQIQDFDFLSGEGLVAAVTRFNDVSEPDKFRVVLAAATTNSVENARVEFAPGFRPKRVALLAPTLFDTTNGPVELDLAIVSITRDAGGDGLLALIDLSDPSKPVLTTNGPALVQLPAGEGTPGSITKRADGLLALATSKSVLLLDPTKLLLPAIALPGGGTTLPAVIGSIDLPAGGVRDFASDTSGLNAVFNGDNRTLVQAEPHFQVVTFNHGPFNPESILDLPEKARSLFLAKAQPVQVVELGLTDTNGNVLPDLSPETHNYVLLDAPGSAADSDGLLPLAVAAIDERGELYAKGARTSVPGVLGDRSVQNSLFVKQLLRLVHSLNSALGSGNDVGPELTPLELMVDLYRSDKAKKVLPELQDLAKLWLSYPGDFQARRMSDDPSSPLYNKFLAGPFVVLRSSPDQDLLQNLLNQAQNNVSNRRYLRASPRLWVGFPESPSGNASRVLGQFASQFKLNPKLTVAGVSVPVISALGERLLSFLIGDSSILGPAALAGLEALVQALAPEVGDFLKTDFDPNLLPGANQLRLVAYHDRPLIFVGGFGGSRLNDSKGEFWPSILRLRTDPTVPLGVLPTGEPSTPTVPPDTLRHVIEAGPIHLANIYGVLLDFLRNEMGYVEYDYFDPRVSGDPSLAIQLQRRRFSGQPILNQDPTPDLFVFAYDFRLDNAKAAALLKEYLDLVRFYHPDADGVDLMAHSNGNLVSRRFMLDNPGVVKHYIDLCGPWLGSGKPFAGMLTGDMEDVAMNFAAPISNLCFSVQFMPGFHQLLINKGAFDLGLRPVVEVGFDLNRDGNAYEAYTYPQYADALQSFIFRETHAKAGFTGPSPARSNQENFHRPDAGLPIADWSHDPPGTRVDEIIGMQAVPRSMAGVRLVGRLHQSTNVDNITLDLPSLQTSEVGDGGGLEQNVGEADGSLGITTNQFRFRSDYEFIKTLGDGTVPILSLARGFGSAIDLNPPGANLHCIVSQAAANDDEAGHNPMLNNPLLFDWLERILENRRVEHLDLSISPAEGVTIGEGTSFQISAAPGFAKPLTDTVTTLFDFGDGGTAARVTTFPAAASASHKYRQNGTYVVSIGATTSAGISGFRSWVIQVTNVPPQVTINGGDVAVALNETRIFTAKVQDKGEDDTHTFTWTVDGHIVPGQSNFAAVVSFPSAGQHQLGVQATDSDGGVGTNQITVTVNAGALPGPVPAQPVSPGIVRAPFGGQSLVFERQPRAFIRVTGHAPGLLDSQGITVRERGIKTYFFEDFLLPQIPSSDLQLLVGLSHLAQRIGGQLIDAVVQRTAQETSTLDLFQTLDGDGSAQVDSLIEFQARGGPLEVELFYSEGDTSIQYTSWVTNASPQACTLKFVWQSIEGTPLFEPTLTVGGQVVAPNHDVLGPASGDRQPPSVAAIFNPATGNITINAQDNVSPANKIDLFLAQDVSGDGRLEDEVFYQLKTNVLARARLPSRKFAIVARDELGNLSSLNAFTIEDTTDYTLGNGSPGGYCDKLNDIRNTVASVITGGLNRPAVKNLFLLDPSHLWMFEQGSGACLWKANSCVECNGNFIPGISDNDYQVFLPSHVARNFQLTPADRSAYLALGVYEQSTMDGDWYFKPPQGLDRAGIPTSDLSAVDQWLYTLPLGFTTPGGQSEILIPNRPASGDLASGFPQPLTPATIIAMTFAQIATNTPLLHESTFFPVRRENFMFGLFDLELPPAGIGADPIGDGGAGRQLLLLKWALEGSFVSLPGLGINQNIPTMDQVYANVRDAGVPVAEGYEWGIFQEFAALDGGVAQDISGEYGPAQAPQLLHSAASNDLEKTQKKHLKKMGKTAIRAALARLAGDPATAHLLFDVDRQGYQARGLPSFEDFILCAITNTPGVATSVFGDFGRDRPLSEGPDLLNFLRAKKGDDELFNEILSDPAGYSRFVKGGIHFLRDVVQTQTRTNYTNYLASLLVNSKTSELTQRKFNHRLILEGDGNGRPGLNQLRRQPVQTEASYTVSANNYSSQNESNVTVTAVVDPTLNPPGLSGEGFGDDKTEPQQVIVGPPAFGGDPVTETVTMSVPAGPNGTPFEPAEEQLDNQLIVKAAVVDLSGPPEIDQPELSVYFTGNNANGAPVSTLLTDYHAQNGRRRAPRYWLRRTDTVDIVVLAQPGLGVLTATVTNVSRGTSLTVALTDTAGNGFYSQGSGNPLQVTDDPNDASKIYLKDEDVVQFIVPLGSNRPTLTNEVMMDAAEIATGGLSFSNRALGALPRLPVFTNFTKVHGFFSAGDQQFADTIAGSGNPGEQFVEQFGSSLPNNGEADFLYILSHGYPDGTLRNHSATLGGNSWFEPDVFTAFLQVTPNAWTTDPDVLILHACFTLNQQTDFTSMPPNVQNTLIRRGFNLLNVPQGALKWKAVMQAAPHPPRMILGFDYLTSQNAVADFADFTDFADQGSPLVKAWADSRPDKAWAFLAFENNLGCTLRKLGPPPLPTDPIIWTDHGSTFPDVPDEEDLGLGIAGGPALRQTEQTRERITAALLPRELILRLQPPQGRWRRTGAALDGRLLLHLPPTEFAGSTNRATLVSAAIDLFRGQIGPSLELKCSSVWPISSKRLRGAEITDLGQTGCSVNLHQTVFGVPVDGAELAANLWTTASSSLIASTYKLVETGPLERTLTQAEATGLVSKAENRIPAHADLQWVRAAGINPRVPPDVFWPVWVFDFSAQAAESKAPTDRVYVHAISGKVLGAQP